MWLSYSYYNTIENERKKYYTQYAKSIEYAYDYCMKNGNTEIICINESVNLIKSTNEPIRIKLTAPHHYFSYEQNNDRYMENRKDVVIIYKFKQNNKITVFIKKATTPPLLTSTLRAMTFSICTYHQGCSLTEYKQAYNKGGLNTLWNYIQHIVFPRSLGSFLLFLLSIGIFFISYKLLSRFAQKEIELERKLNRKINQLRYRQTDIERLKREIYEKNESQTQYNQQLELLKDKLKYSNTILNELSQENTQLKQSISNYEAEIHHLETQYQSNIEDIEHTRLQLQEAKQQLALEQEKIQLENSYAIQELERDMQEYENQIESHKQQTMTLKNSIQVIEKDKEHQLENMRHQISELLSRNKEQENSYHQQLSKLQEQLAQSNQQLSIFNQENEELKNRINNYQLLISNLEEKYQNNLREIEKVNIKLKDTQEKLAQEQLTKTHLSQKNTEGMKTQLSLIQHLEQEIINYELEIRQHQQDNISLRKEIQHIENDKNVSQAKFDSMHDKILELEAMIEQNQENQLSTQDFIETLAKENQELQTQSKALSVENNNLQELIDNYVQKISELEQDKLNSIEKANLRLEKVKKQLKKEKEKVSNIEHQKQTQIDALEQSIQQHEQQNIELLENISRLKQDKLQSQNQVADLCEKIDSLNQNIQTMTHQQIETQNSIDQLAEEKNKLNEKIHSINQEKNDLYAELTDSKVKIKEIEQQLVEQNQWEQLIADEDAKRERISAERDKLYNTNIELEREKNKLIIQLEDLSKEYHLLEQSHSSPHIKSAEQILLKNPNIIKGSQKIHVNQGKHHSKDYVKALSKKLDKFSDYGIILSILAIEYNANQHKTLILSLKETYNEQNFALKVYGSTDAGYASELILNTSNSWEAILYAKFIQEGIAEFQDYRLKVKI